MIVYRDVEVAWQDMLNAILQAKKSILFEQYLVRDMDEGQIGHILASALLKKTKEGVKVRILVDAIGSYKFILSDLWEDLKSAGADLEVFGIIPHWRFRVEPPLFNRNHRKLLIVDDSVVHVGGVVFSESVRGWQDFNVEFQIGIEEFRHSYEIMSRTAKAEVNNQIFKAGDISIANIIPLHDQYHKHLLVRLNKATKAITVISPYFSPDLKVRRALYRAAKRGVRVTIVLPSKTDNIFADMSSHSFVGTLIRKGVEVRINSGKINHAKIVMIDDWITFGSMNFDRLSFFYNYELNVESENNVIARQLQEEAGYFVNAAEPVDLETWHAASTIELLRRKIGFLLRPFV